MKCFFTQSYGNIVKKGWVGDLRRNKTEARMSPIHVSGGSKAVFPLAPLVMRELIGRWFFRRMICQPDTAHACFIKGFGLSSAVCLSDGLASDASVYRPVGYGTAEEVKCFDHLSRS
jgi:hypothetical protein